jgi:hypothetical protein
LELDVDGGRKLSQYQQEAFFLIRKLIALEATTVQERRLLQSSASNLLTQMNVPQHARTDRRFCCGSRDRGATAPLDIHQGAFRGRQTDTKIR